MSLEVTEDHTGITPKIQFHLVTLPCMREAATLQELKEFHWENDMVRCQLWQRSALLERGLTMDILFNQRPCWGYEHMRWFKIDDFDEQCIIIALHTCLSLLQSAENNGQILLIPYNFRFISQLNTWKIVCTNKRECACLFCRMVISAGFWCLECENKIIFLW